MLLIWPLCIVFQDTLRLLLPPLASSWQVHHLQHHNTTPLLKFHETLLLIVLESCSWFTSDSSSLVCISLPLQCAAVVFILFYVILLLCSLGLRCTVIKGPLRLSQVLLNKTFSSWSFANTEAEGREKTYSPLVLFFFYMFYFHLCASLCRCVCVCVCRAKFPSGCSPSLFLACVALQLCRKELCPDYFYL